MVKEIDNDLLYKTILTRLISEDYEITLLTKQGIFFAPELYIAFILGKEIKKNEMAIFGEEVEWVRETDFGNGGPSDLAFKADDITCVFELKLRNTLESYIADIDKLAGLGADYRKFFIALVDSWEKDRDKDKRITELENNKTLSRISTFTSFPTKQERYTGEIYCTVGLWEIGKY